MDFLLGRAPDLQAIAVATLLDLLYINKNVPIVSFYLFIKRLKPALPALLLYYEGILLRRKKKRDSLINESFPFQFWTFKFLYDVGALDYARRLLPMPSADFLSFSRRAVVKEYQFNISTIGLFDSWMHFEYLKCICAKSDNFCVTKRNLNLKHDTSSPIAFCRCWYRIVEFRNE